LCRSYWYPLYAYVRRKGHSPHDSQDLTQEFFARLLEKNYIQLAAPERGKFRSFLLKSLNHFLVNEWVRDHAQKRGGGQPLVSLDEEDAERIYQQEPMTGLAPESLYDKRWAMTLLERAMERLGDDYAAAGKRELFDQLRNLLLAEGPEVLSPTGRNAGTKRGAVKVAVIDCAIVSAKRSGGESPKPWPLRQKGIEELHVASWPH
jgi:RNA polymerase sigma-70 factor (ECF subfamily)